MAWHMAMMERVLLHREHQRLNVPNIPRLVEPVEFDGASYVRCTSFQAREVMEGIRKEYCGENAA
jgi:hypothetical protein